MSTFVSATRRIIDEEGIKAASIRRVSSVTGYSMGTMYLYFKDLNELTTMSLVSYLNNYAKEIIRTAPHNESPEDTYQRLWYIFCKHGFKQPWVFLNLFFGPCSENLNDIIKKYYELFPNEIENASDVLLDMLKRGNLKERNWMVLSSLANKLGFTPHEIDVANNLTVSAFHTHLLFAAEHELTDEEQQQHTQSFMEEARFVLYGPASRHA